MNLYIQPAKFETGDVLKLTGSTVESVTVFSEDCVSFTVRTTGGRQETFVTSERFNPEYDVVRSTTKTEGGE